MLTKFICQKACLKQKKVTFTMWVKSIWERILIPLKGNQDYKGTKIINQSACPLYKAMMYQKLFHVIES